MAGIGDPVAVGAVTRLDVPGGNVTGFSTQNLELETKRLELLREIVPNAGRIALLGNSGNPYSTTATDSISKVAHRIGVAIDAVEAEARAGLDRALTEIAAWKPAGVLMLSIPAFFPDREKITAFMADNRLPAIYPYPEFVTAGGLASYATDFDDLFRQAAGYVDKILRGTKPGDLPVQQAAAFRLVVSLRAAKALGLAIPQLVLARADEVIE